MSEERHPSVCTLSSKMAVSRPKSNIGMSGKGKKAKQVGLMG